MNDKKYQDASIKYQDKKQETRGRKNYDLRITIYEVLYGIKAIYSRKPYNFATPIFQSSNFEIFQFKC